MESVHGQLLENATNAVRDLGLDGIGQDSIALMASPQNKAFFGVKELPGIIITPYDFEELIPTEGTVSKDDIGYPVRIAIVDAANAVVEKDALDLRLLWRELLIDHFIHAQMTVSICQTSVNANITVKPLSIVDPNAWFARDAYVSGIELRCKVRKQRRQAA